MRGKGSPPSLRWGATGIACLLWAITAQAEPPGPARLTVWDLKLGTKAADLPRDAFADYACGTDGGPPGRPLHGWTDYAQCQAEPDGRREVYFRYDDELEYIARAHRFVTQIEQYGGTKISGFPVILSALFDPAGNLAGLRIVTDPRADPHERRGAYGLAGALLGRFGDALTCADLPPGDGESPVGNLFVKKHCTGTYRGETAQVDAKFFRKPGQAELDPHTGAPTKGQWESECRAEIGVGR